MAPRSIARRSLLLGALLLPTGACTQMSGMFGGARVSTLSRGDRMVRWLQNTGAPRMMAPETFELMGIRNPGVVKDIPARQIGEDGPDGRYVVSLVNIRQIHEFVFHRRQGDVLTFHHSDTRFARLISIRYPRNGRPVIIQDAALAESDFQQQIAFWFRRMPGR